MIAGYYSCISKFDFSLRIHSGGICNWRSRVFFHVNWRHDYLIRTIPGNNSPTFPNVWRSHAEALPKTSMQRFCISPSGKAKASYKDAKDQTCHQEFQRCNDPTYAPDHPEEAEIRKASGSSCRTSFSYSCVSVSCFVPFSPWSPNRYFRCCHDNFFSWTRVHCPPFRALQLLNLISTLASDEGCATLVQPKYPCRHASMGECLLWWCEIWFLIIPQYRSSASRRYQAIWQQRLTGNSLGNRYEH